MNKDHEIVDIRFYMNQRPTATDFNHMFLQINNHNHNYGFGVTEKYLGLQIDHGFYDENTIPEYLTNNYSTYNISPDNHHNRPHPISTIDINAVHRGELVTDDINNKEIGPLELRVDGITSEGLVKWKEEGVQSPQDGFYITDLNYDQIWISGDVEGHEIPTGRPSSYTYDLLFKQHGEAALTLRDHVFSIDYEKSCTYFNPHGNTMQTIGDVSDDIWVPYPFEHMLNFAINYNYTWNYTINLTNKGYNIIEACLWKELNSYGNALLEYSETDTSYPFARWLDKGFKTWNTQTEEYEKFPLFFGPKYFIPNSYHAGTATLQHAFSLKMYPEFGYRSIEDSNIAMYLAKYPFLLNCLGSLRSFDFFPKYSDPNKDAAINFNHIYPLLRSNNYWDLNSSYTEFDHNPAKLPATYYPMNHDYLNISIPGNCIQNSEKLIGSLHSQTNITNYTIVRESITIEGDALNQNLSCSNITAPDENFTGMHPKVSCYDLFTKRVGSMPPFDDNSLRHKNPCYQDTLSDTLGTYNYQIYGSAINFQRIMFPVTTSSYNDLITFGSICKQTKFVNNEKLPNPLYSDVMAPGVNYIGLGLDVKEDGSPNYIYPPQGIYQEDPTKENKWAYGRDKNGFKILSFPLKFKESYTNTGDGDSPRRFISNEPLYLYHDPNNLKATKYVLPSVAFDHLCAPMWTIPEEHRKGIEEIKLTFVIPSNTMGEGKFESINLGAESVSNHTLLADRIIVLIKGKAHKLKQTITDTVIDYEMSETPVDIVFARVFPLYLPFWKMHNGEENNYYANRIYYDSTEAPTTDIEIPLTIKLNGGGWVTGSSYGNLWVVPEQIKITTFSTAGVVWAGNARLWFGQMSDDNSKYNLFSPYYHQYSAARNPNCSRNINSPFDEYSEYINYHGWEVVANDDLFFTNPIRCRDIYHKNEYPPDPPYPPAPDPSYEFVLKCPDKNTEWYTYETGQSVQIQWTCGPRIGADAITSFLIQYSSDVGNHSWTSMGHVDEIKTEQENVYLFPYNLCGLDEMVGPNWRIRIIAIAGAHTATLTSELFTLYLGEDRSFESNLKPIAVEYRPDNENYESYIQRPGRTAVLYNMPYAISTDICKGGDEGNTPFNNTHWATKYFSGNTVIWNLRYSYGSPAESGYFTYTAAESIKFNHIYTGNAYDTCILQSDLSGTTPTYKFLQVFGRRFFCIKKLEYVVRRMYMPLSPALPRLSQYQWYKPHQDYSDLPWIDFSSNYVFDDFSGTRVDIAIMKNRINDFMNTRQNSVLAFYLPVFKGCGTTIDIKIKYLEKLLPNSKLVLTALPLDKNEVLSLTPNINFEYYFSGSDTPNIDDPNFMANMKDWADNVFNLDKKLIVKKKTIEDNKSVLMVDALNQSKNSQAWPIKTDTFTISLSKTTENTELVLIMVTSQPNNINNKIGYGHERAFEDQSLIGIAYVYTYEDSDPTP